MWRLSAFEVKTLQKFHSIRVLNYSEANFYTYIQSQNKEKKSNVKRC